MYPESLVDLKIKIFRFRWADKRALTAYFKCFANAFMHGPNCSKNSDAKKEHFTLAKIEVLRMISFISEIFSLLEKNLEKLVNKTETDQKVSGATPHK